MRHRWLATLILTVLLGAAPVWAQAGTRLNWTDNSSGDGQEQFFEIERKVVPNPVPLPTVPPYTIACGGTPGTYSQIATTVSPDVVTYNDLANTAGTSYCWRVRAHNQAGNSGYSNEAGRYIPFLVPANPSALGATPLP